MPRRMFSPQIIDSDAFLDMPQSSQNLYFHLGMRADDDGFVGNPRKILRIINGSEDDLKVLIAKRFVISFETGVIVIKHWRINNLIRKDWYRETLYIEEKKSLILKENGSYSELKKDSLVNEYTPKLTHRLGKDRLGKDKDTYSSLDFLMNIPKDVIDEFSIKYNVYEQGIKEKAEDLFDYCESKGKKYKNYKAFLRKALKKDFGLRKIIDKDELERIKITQEKHGSSEFAKELSNNFKII